MSREIVKYDKNANYIPILSLGTTQVIHSFDHYFVPQGYKTVFCLWIVAKSLILPTFLIDRYQ